MMADFLGYVFFATRRCTCGFKEDGQDRGFYWGHWKWEDGFLSWHCGPNWSPFSWLSQPTPALCTSTIKLCISHVSYMISCGEPSQTRKDSEEDSKKWSPSWRQHPWSWVDRRLAIDVWAGSLWHFPPAHPKRVQYLVWRDHGKHFKTHHEGICRLSWDIWYGMCPVSG